MANHVKKGDQVVIIAGAHKGRTGKVLAVDYKKQRVVVQGQNLVKKHVRPSRQNPQGGRVNVEQPIHLSNVMPVNPATGRGTRVRFVVGDDGTKRRVAVDGTEISVLKRSK